MFSVAFHMSIFSWLIFNVQCKLGIGERGRSITKVDIEMFGHCRAF